MEDFAPAAPPWNLLNDRNFCQLVRRWERESITWDEFLTLPLPHDMSAVQTWEVLQTLSRCVGMDVVVPDLEDNRYWYRLTYQLNEALSAVAFACRSHSHIHRRLTHASAGQHFLVQMRIAETIGAARLDGLDISEDSANELLRSGRAPQSETERFVLNTFRADDQLPSLVDEPFSLELFMHLRDLLVEGVDMDELMSRPRSLGIIPYDYDDETVSRFSRRQLDYIKIYANHEAGEEWISPILRSLLIADAMRFYRPLGKVSSQVGRLIARLYAMKHDLPVLGLLAVSRAKVDWEEGRIGPPEVMCTRATFDAFRVHSPGDLTIMHTVLTQLALRAIGSVEDYIEKWERRDDEMREILRKDPLLNHRQRGIVGDALRSPAAEFRIRYHQTNHNIAYATARRDLLALTEKGYLTEEHRGNALVFVPSERLHELVTAARSDRL